MILEIEKQEDVYHLSITITGYSTDKEKTLFKKEVTIKHFYFDENDPEIIAEQLSKYFNNQILQLCTKNMMLEVPAALEFEDMISDYKIQKWYQT